MWRANKVGNFQAVFQVSHTVNQQLRAAVTNFIVKLPTLLSCHNSSKVSKQSGKLIFADSFFQTHLPSNSMMSFFSVIGVNFLLLDIVNTKLFKSDLTMAY